MQKRVLIVEDDQGARLAARRALESAHYAVQDVSEEEAARREAKQFKPHLIVIDLKLRDSDLEAGLRLLGSLPPDIPKIIWSGASDGNSVRHAFDQPSQALRAQGYVFKSEGLDALVNRVRLELAEAKPYQIWAKRGVLVAAAGLFLFGLYKLAPLLVGKSMNEDILVGILSNLLFAILVFIVKVR